jgi:hypothetical protein
MWFDLAAAEGDRAQKTIGIHKNNLGTDRETRRLADE